ALQVQAIGFDIAGIASGDSLFLAGCELDPQGASDRQGYLLLNGEYVANLALVRFRPQVVSVGAVVQLRRDPQRVACSSYAAFQPRRDVELRADLPDVLSLPLEFERGSSGRHTQTVELG